MSKKLIALSLVLVCSFAMIIEQAFTNSNRPPSSTTNAPGEGSCVTCHNTSAINSGLGNVSITIAGEPIKYKPDSIYDLTVAVTDTSMDRFGFEITTLDANDEMAGTYTIGASTSLQSASIDGNIRKYVSHSNAGTKNSWTFKWKAPADGTGLVTFYAIGNATNNNLSSAGDFVYTTTLELEQDSVPTSTGVNYTNAKPYFSFYPNPATDNITVTTFAAGSLKMYDMNGQLKAEYKCSSKGANKIKLNRDELPNGVYILNFTVGKNSSSSKIYLQ